MLRREIAVKTMGKRSVDVNSVLEIENKTYGDMRPKKYLKTSTKDVKLKMKKGINSKVESEDVVEGTSILKGFDKLEKRRKKRKKRSKMGSPIIVEGSIEKCPKIEIPAALRDPVFEKSPISVSNSLGAFGLGVKKNENKESKAKITIAECINPSTMDRNEKSIAESMQEIVSVPMEQEFEEIPATNSNRDFPTKNKKRFRKHVEPMEEQEEHSVSKNQLTIEDNSSIENKFQDDNLDERETKQLPRFYSLKNKVLAMIEPDWQFSFHGKLQIRVFYGAVRIYGAVFNSKKTEIPVKIYSPRAYSPIAIEAIESEIDDRNLDDVWKFLGEHSADRKFAKRLQSDIDNLQDGWAFVELENFDDQLTNFLENYCPYHLFPRINDPSNHSWRDARRAEIVLQANLRFIASCKQLTIDSRGIDDFADGICYDWDTKDASRTIIAGGKAVGKSTTARYLVNKLLAKSKAVLIMDLDPGQGEFTPAGTISLNVVQQPLLGPNFTHLKTPYYEIYVGSADVTRCFTHYVDGVKKLVNRIVDDPKLRRLPLVVNTMGFCKDIGWDIINYIIKLVSPTDVVQILSRRSKNNFHDTLSRQVVDRQTLDWITWAKDTISKDNKPAKHRLHVIYSEAETPSGTAESWNLEAHQHRELVMLAYLSQIIEKDSSSFALSQRTSITSINSVAPYAVPFSAVSVALAGAFIPQVLSVMNGNIVALCGIDAEVDSTEESNSQEDIVASYPRVLIRPPLSTCYGFGILRGVDMEKEKLFINTPLTPNEMQHVNCLIGCVNLPQSLLQLNQEGAPYTGGEYDLPTSRGSRRGYYRMRYQTDT